MCSWGWTPTGWRAGTCATRTASSARWAQRRGVGWQVWTRGPGVQHMATKVGDASSADLP